MTETFPLDSTLLVRKEIKILNAPPDLANTFRAGERGTEVETDVRTSGFSLAVVVLFGMHSPAYAQHQNSGHLIVVRMERATVRMFQVLFSNLKRHRKLNTGMELERSYSLLCIFTFGLPAERKQQILDYHSQGLDSSCNILLVCEACKQLLTLRAIRRPLPV